jgi:DNA-binding transcriptional regulator YhcF (GntR family)
VILAALLSITVVAVAMGYAGRGEGSALGPGRGRAGFFDQLSEEQRDALHATVREMRDAGAAREEVHAAVRERLVGWGIELPEHPTRSGGRGDGRRVHHPPFFDQLTGEQRHAIHELVVGMREAGASREEIRAAVHETLASWGIELPDMSGERRCHRREIFEQLSDEQRSAVHNRISEMREAGASREEVRAAVREMLEGFGIGLPESGAGERSPELLESQNAKSATWGEIKGSFK